MITHGSEETKKFAGELAKKILKTPLLKEKGAFAVGLKGDLGGGKTTFVQGFAKGLGIKEKITSPTFNIFKKFRISKPEERFSHFYHFDCYRIENPEEVLPLGFKEIISDPQNIVLMEWAENIKEILPKNTKWITFKSVDESTREIILN